MVGSNKILTVSYGTFSCTLEGFDNPFGTMQSIAEYFRDLAAEDRYFGAEPPQPDAQMLHQIAEREVRKRVEARVGDNSVVLRQMAPAGRSDDAPAARVAPAPVAPLEAAPADPVVAEDVETSPFASGAEGDSVADKLSRIRAVVARARAERARSFEEDEGVVEDAVLSGSIDAAFEGLELDPHAEADDFATEVPVDDDSESDRTSAADMEATTDDEAETEALPLLTDPTADMEVDSVAREDDGEDADHVPADADHAVESAVAEDEIPAHESSASDGEDDFDDDAAPGPVAVDRDDPIVAVERETTEESADEDPAREVATHQAERPMARVIKLKRRDFEAALAAGDIEEIDDDDAFGDDVAEFDLEDDDTEGDEDDDNTNAFAEDDEDHDDDGNDENLASEIRSLLDGSGLEPDEEDELVAELAQVERDARALSDSADGVSPDAPTDSEAPRRAENGALDRLMDQANARMGEPEGNRRRTAIAHLKAAVAATRADDGLREARETEGKRTIDQFRDDLAHVVRPSRPVAVPGDGGQPTRSDQSRPAPLVLVSAQRVDGPRDADAPQAVTPSRPRRGTGAEDRRPVAAPDGTESFAEFAERTGAHDLISLLEAAAAYAKVVEGLDGVSRPQIMRRAMGAVQEGVSREDGLRGFGHLLRAGRIRKTGDGQFSIADPSEFLSRTKAG